MDFDLEEGELIEQNFSLNETCVSGFCFLNIHFTERSVSVRIISITLSDTLNNNLSLSVAKITTISGRNFDLQSCPKDCIVAIAVVLQQPAEVICWTDKYA